MRECLKAREVMEILGCARITLYRWREEGRGPAFVRLDNGHYRYPKAEFETWMKERTVPAGGGFSRKTL